MFPFGETVMVAGIRISAAAVTVTLAVASVRPAVVARITDEPAETPVTVIVVDVVPAAIVAIAGTVATAEFDELMLNTKPCGPAGLARVKVRVWEPVPEMLSELGDRVAVVVT